MAKRMEQGNTDQEVSDTTIEISPQEERDKVLEGVIEKMAEAARKESIEGGGIPIAVRVEDALKEAEDIYREKDFRNLVDELKGVRGVEEKLRDAKYAMAESLYSEYRAQVESATKNAESMGFDSGTEEIDGEDEKKSNGFFSGIIKEFQGAGEAFADAYYKLFPGDLKRKEYAEEIDGLMAGVKNKSEELAKKVIEAMPEGIKNNIMELQDKTEWAFVDMHKTLEELRELVKEKTGQDFRDNFDPRSKLIEFASGLKDEYIRDKLAKFTSEEKKSKKLKTELEEMIAGAGLEYFPR